jgi:hypothetical protein
MGFKQQEWQFLKGFGDCKIDIIVVNRQNIRA